MKPNVTDLTYHIYLLRCWSLHQPPSPGDWRFTLVHPHTNAQRTFSTLTALVDFLHAQIGLEITPAADATPLSNQLDE